MNIQQRPLVDESNIACQYCYNNQRCYGEQPKQRYNIYKKHQLTFQLNQPSIRLDNETMPTVLDNLKEILECRYEHYGATSIQMSCSDHLFITDEHIQLFKQFETTIDILIDEVEELQTVNKTKLNIKAIHYNIQRLCENNIAPRIVVTLHKGNAMPQCFDKTAEWMLKLDEMGVPSIRLQLMEIDHKHIIDSYNLNEQQKIDAIIYLHKLKPSFKQLKLEIFSETEKLQKVEEQERSDLWGENKDISFVKDNISSYVRYMTLYNKPQTEGGCQGCRFFSMCKGYSSKTAINNDWRNRTEHCGVWKVIFSLTENDMIENGEVPLSKYGLLPVIEKTLIANWMQEKNVSIQNILSSFHLTVS